MEGRQIAQWDKDSCADAGFLKIDLLGLGMLSAVERTVDEIARVRGERIDLSRIPLDDPEVYRRIQRRGDDRRLPDREPRADADAAALASREPRRPHGPGGDRPARADPGRRRPSLPRAQASGSARTPATRSPTSTRRLEPILSDTLGAIVFQDQVIQVAMALAGFSSGEAEGLRRAMSRKRSEEAMQRPPRALRRRRDRDAASIEAIAERVFAQIHGFSGFGFPKSHAAAFGLLAYQSTWLRVHYGPEFLCSLLNEQPMGFYPPDALVHEAQRRGIEVRPPDVNASAVLCRGRGRWKRAGGPDRARLRQGDAPRRDAEAVVGEREQRRRPTATSGIWPRGRAPGATGSSGSPGPGACGDLGGGGGDRRRTPLWRLGDRPRLGRRSARAAAADAGGPGAGRADAVGAGHRRLRRLRHRPRRAPARAPPRRPAAGDGHLRGARPDPRRLRARRRRPAGRPPAPGDREGRHVHADRGRDGGRERDRRCRRSTSATG